MTRIVPTPCTLQSEGKESAPIVLKNLTKTKRVIAIHVIITVDFAIFVLGQQKKML